MTLLDNSVVPKWNEEPSTLDAFEERVILYVLGTKKEERYLSPTASTWEHESLGHGHAQNSDLLHRGFHYRFVGGE